MNKILRISYQNPSLIDELEKNQEQINKVYQNVLNRQIIEKKFLAWIDLPEKELENNKIEYLESLAKDLVGKDIKVLVVIGTGSAILPTKTIYENIYKIDKNKKNIELLFVGQSISAESLIEQLKYVENKRFAINVISKSGAPIEPALAFREFRKLLESKIGANNAKKLIFITSDSKKGVLHDLASENNYKFLNIPEEIVIRFAAFSNVTLFPLMCAGIDVKNYLKGALEANKNFKIFNFEQNYAYKYTALKYSLSKKINVELFEIINSKNSTILKWIIQLLVETRSKNGKGLFTSNTYNSQMNLKHKNVLKTIINFKNNQAQNLDNLEKEYSNKLPYLDGTKLHEVNWSLLRKKLITQENFLEEDDIRITIENINEFNFGFLFQMFFYIATMNGVLNGVNPFNQPGVDVYKNNIFKSFKE